MTAESLAARLDLDPVEQGFVFRRSGKWPWMPPPARRPLACYFLYFSFFVIAAAVMLVVLLFRLGIEQRAKQLGLLLALGFRRRQAARLLMIEGLIVAAAGSAIGTLAGVGYAALMLLGLRTWWLPAIGTPFLTLHVEWQSPAIGFASGLVLAAVAIWLAALATGPHRAAAADGGRCEYTVHSTPYPAFSKAQVGSAICNLQFAICIFQLFLFALLLLALLPPLVLIARPA